MKTVAMMPIKLNNERLPGKNTRMLGGRPLLQHELGSLMLTGLVDELYVYCSSEEVVPYLPPGVAFLKRPGCLDLPESNFTQIFEAFRKERDADVYVLAHATAPFVTVETMRECILAVRDGGYDSAFCARRIQTFLWSGGGPLNFDPSDLPRTQDIEPVYRETSGIYVFESGVFDRYRRRIGVRPYIKCVSFREAVDIDEAEDFELAEILAGEPPRRGAPPRGEGKGEFSMDRFNLLECTLRDGGYVTGWRFSPQMIRDTIRGLLDANMDFVEVGYLNSKPYEEGSTQFQSIEQIADFLPESRGDSVLLAMADVQQFLPSDLTPRTGRSIDGIRVVFYKHQVEEALAMCEAVRDAGYELFVQPMVTIDYGIDEYARLAKRIAALGPYGVSIVDSFGYMIKEDFRRYFKVLDNLLPPGCAIGFHSHNNMNLSFLTGQDILEYETERRLIIDSSLYGMGRGAGNLQTELIANYYNMTLGWKYDTMRIMELISRYIMPIREKREWGYSPYYFLTATYKCHPNYAAYLLEEHDVTVSEFGEFLKTIPDEMRTKCRKPYVLSRYEEFASKKNDVDEGTGPLGGGISRHDIRKRCIWQKDDSTFGSIARTGRIPEKGVAA